MKENIGFNQDLARQVEKKALNQNGFVGIEDTLEEDRHVAKIIGKNFEQVEMLKDMEEAAVSFQENQGRYFDKVEYQLHDLGELIRAQEKFLDTYHDKKQERQRLHKENLKAHVESNPAEYHYQETDLEKQIVSLEKDIKALYMVIKSEKITPEGISNFREQYEKLNEKYQRISQIWNPENAPKN